jgi:superfamily I DNA and RNA helicase
MIFALLIMSYLTWWALNQKKQAQESLIRSYQSEIRTLEKDLSINKINLSSFKTFEAEDAIRHVNEKIQRLDSTKNRKEIEMNKIKKELKLDTSNNKMEMNSK